MSTLDTGQQAPTSLSTFTQGTRPVGLPRRSPRVSLFISPEGIHARCTKKPAISDSGLLTGAGYAVIGVFADSTPLLNALRRSNLDFPLCWLPTPITGPRGLRSVRRRTAGRIVRRYHPLHCRCCLDGNLYIGQYRKATGHVACPGKALQMTNPFAS